MESGTWHGVMGETLRERRAELLRAVQAARLELEAFDEAWEEGDYDWLADAGYLRRELFENVKQESDAV